MVGYMGDSDVILSTTVNAAMLEVYLLQQCNVVNVCFLTVMCELHTSQNARSVNNFGTRIFILPHFNTVTLPF